MTPLDKSYGYQKAREHQAHGLINLKFNVLYLCSYCRCVRSTVLAEAK